MYYSLFIILMCSVICGAAEKNFQFIPEIQLSFSDPTVRDIVEKYAPTHHKTLEETVMSKEDKEKLVTKVDWIMAHSELYKSDDLFIIYLLAKFASFPPANDVMAMYGIKQFEQTDRIDYLEVAIEYIYIAIQQDPECRSAELLCSIGLQKYLETSLPTLERFKKEFRAKYLASDLYQIYKKNARPSSKDGSRAGAAAAGTDGDL